MSTPIPATDTTMSVIEYAIRGLTLRNEVTANNIANAEVPGFHGSEVAFEATLQRALQSSNIDRVGSPQIQATGAPAGANGNNVQLEKEMVEMMRTNLLQGAMINAFNFKIGILQSAIGVR